MEPFISVITVSLNAVKTIGDTIASVRKQRCPFEIEHVCVDGGSTDGTREVIDGWASRSSHLDRVYEPDTGIFDAMNKGLYRARGEYVLFLNADDFLLGPDALQEAMSGLMPGSAGNPDLIMGDVVMGKPGAMGVWRHRRVPRLLARIRALGFYPYHQGLLAKRSILQEVGGFDSKLKLAADVNQYYGLERRPLLSFRLLGADLAFMQAGGAANAGLKAMYVGTAEIYRYLRPIYGSARAAFMVAMKTAQSVSELRYGRVRAQRWFAQ